MAKFSDLVKAFRENVRLGIPSELRFTGTRIELSTTEGNGFVGMCNRPKPKSKPKGGKVIGR